MEIIKQVEDQDQEQVQDVYPQNQYGCYQDELRVQLLAVKYVEEKRNLYCSRNSLGPSEELQISDERKSNICALSKLALRILDISIFKFLFFIFHPPHVLCFNQCCFNSGLCSNQYCFNSACLTFSFHQL